MTKSIRLTSKLFWGACLTLGLLILGLAPSLAAPPPQAPPLKVGTWRYGRNDDLAQVAAIGQLDEGPELTAQGVNFVVHYNPAGGCVTDDLPNFLPSGTLVDWPVEAQVAFEYAMNIWDNLLVISQPIAIHACWANISGPLGSGQPFSAFSNFTNAPQTNTLYPVALANQLAQSDLNGTDPEIIIVFNSNIDWYYGTDAEPDGGKRDFVTVAMHEMAHGLGMISTFFVNSGVDMCGTGNASDNQGCWGKDGPTTPGNTFNDQYAIFDMFVENSSAHTLTNTSLFANPSSALGSQLTGGAVYFNGPEASAKNGGHVPLYAPGSFDIGSSILHLNQTTYENTFNRMMTPTYAGPTHHPGPIVLGMFKDMGWDVFDLPLVTLTQSASANQVTAGQVLTYTLTVTNTGYAVMTDVVITDTVPAHTTLNVGSPSGNVTTSGTTPGSVITWTTGVTLTTSKALSRTFAVTIDAELAGVSTIVNTACVTSTAGVGAHATLDTTIARNTYLPIILRKEN